MTSDGKNQQKKPYSSPVIEVYGNIRTITKSVGTTGMNDGGMTAGMTKTG